MKEVYLKYPPERDTLFVLGAGASHPDGVPLKKDIIPLLLSETDKTLMDSVIGQDFIKFLYDVFAYSPKLKNYPPLEAVFGFLDYFIVHNESLSSHYTNSKLRDIKEYFIKLIHYIVNTYSDTDTTIYHLFWNRVNEINRNISVITLNYDTLLEQGFNFMFRKRGYIDYGLHLMNFDNFKGLERYNFWINPSEPIAVNEEDDPVPFKILKLHGSLNWKYCNCCNQVLLTPWDKQLDLNKGKFLGYTYPDMEKYEYSCPIDNTDFQTLIVPPSYGYELKMPAFHRLYSDAAREIRRAKKIVFIGYSFDHSDIHIKALFQKNINSACKVFVVNKNISSELKTQYNAISSNTKFYSITFERYLEEIEYYMDAF